MGSTLRSSLEEKWEMKLQALLFSFSCLWIAEHTGFLLTRFEVGRNGKIAYEGRKGIGKGASL